MSEYGRYAPSYSTVRDVSVYLLDGSRERLLTFNGEDERCDTELFRHTLRDPSGRVLTDYKADNQGYCDCSVAFACMWTDRFERDYIWLGNQGLAILDRQQAPRFDVTDHQGSPRHAFNTAGTPLGDRVFAPFGEEFGVAGSMPERLRFTGHERNHVSGSDGQFLAISDYMHARNYAPTLSRFVTPDSRPGFHLFDPESANRYAYALNNPATYTDPTGNDEQARQIPVVTNGKVAAIGVTAEDPDTEWARAKRGQELRLWLTDFVTYSRSFGRVNDRIRAVASEPWMDPFGRHVLHSAADFLPDDLFSVAGATWLATVSFTGGEQNALLLEAEALYPKLAGRLNWHHVIPKYLGGAVDGELVRLNSAYHQLITNAFRRAWPYGQGKPTPEQLKEIVRAVYKQYPIR